MSEAISEDLIRQAEQIAAGPASAYQADRPKPQLLMKAEFVAGFVPPDYLVDQILQRRFVYALTARTGHGKTALALLIARLVSGSDARPMFGSHEVDKGTVVYFAGENPDDVRIRAIVDDKLARRDPHDDRIAFIPGTFNLAAMFEACKAGADRLGGKLDLIIVDTSAAYFTGDDENSSAQMGPHARDLRRLTELPGGPCVLVLCHPAKHVDDARQLLPRGSGAFVAEIDGNLTLWKTDDTVELSHTDKLRGPGFEPMTFRLERIQCPAVIDSKGRELRTVRAVAMTDHDHELLNKSARADEDALLVAMIEPGRSIAQLAVACGWVTGDGQPHKSKTQRRLVALEKASLVRKNRGVWELSDKGKTAAGAATGPSRAS